MSGLESSSRALVRDRIDASFATDDPENQRVREKSRIDPDVRACEGENQRVRKIASEKIQSLLRARRDRDGGLAGSGME